MAVTYCTAEDVRTYSNNADFTEVVGGEGADAEDYVMTDEQIEAKIEAAELVIDSEARFWERAGGITQARVFPRIEDAAIGVDIPDRIKHATIAQVEFAHENAPDIDHGITEGNTPTRQTISPRARKLMTGYIRKTGQTVLTQPVNPGML